MELELTEFISEEHVAHLDELKETIDDEIKHNNYITILLAEKHYFSDLTQDERKQKAQTESYTEKKYDEIVKCPACGNNALLRKKIQSTNEQLENHEVIKRYIILKDLSCYHCGLNITDYDQLKYLFDDKEYSFKDLYYNYPDDCGLEDCPDDCGPEDCPVDCPDYDCPDDCGPEDCPDDCGPEDCPDDCGPEDCPDDCGPEDCPDDCGPEDCPNDCGPEER